MDHLRHRLVFWRRARRATLSLLVVWLVTSIGVPWFARDLDQWHWLGFPLGWWLASEGALLIYLAIIVADVVVMERLEAALAAGTRDDASAAAAAGRRDD